MPDMALGEHPNLIPEDPLEEAKYHHHHHSGVHEALQHMEVAMSSIQSLESLARNSGGPHSYQQAPVVPQHQPISLPLQEGGDSGLWEVNSRLSYNGRRSESPMREYSALLQPPKSLPPVQHYPSLKTSDLQPHSALSMMELGKTLSPSAPQSLSPPRSMQSTPRAPVSFDHSRMHHPNHPSPESMSRPKARTTIGLAMHGLEIDHIVPGGPAHLCRELDPGDEIVAIDHKDANPGTLGKQLLGCDIPGTPLELQVMKAATREMVHVRLFRVSAEEMARTSMIFDIVMKLKANADTNANFEKETYAPDRATSQILLDGLAEVISDEILDHKESVVRIKEETERVLMQIRTSHQAAVRGMEDHIELERAANIKNFGIDRTVSQEVPEEEETVVRTIKEAEVLEKDRLMAAQLEEAVESINKLADALKVSQSLGERQSINLRKARDHIEAQDHRIAELQRQHEKEVEQLEAMIAKQEEDLIMLEADKQVNTDRIIALEAELDHLGRTAGSATTSMENLEIQSRSQSNKLSQLLDLTALQQEELKVKGRRLQELEGMQNELRGVTGHLALLCQEVQWSSDLVLRLQEADIRNRNRILRLQDELSKTIAERDEASAELEKLHASYRKSLKHNAELAKHREAIRKAAREMHLELLQLTEGPDSVPRIESEIGIQYEEIQAKFISRDLQVKIVNEKFESDRAGLDRAKKNISEQDYMIKVRDEQIADLKEKLKQALHDIIPIQDELEVLMEERRSHISMMHDQKEMIAELKNKHTELVRLVNHHESEVSVKQIEIEDLRSKVKSLTEEVKRRQDAWNEQEERHNDLKRNFAELQRVAQRYKEEHLQESKILKSKIDGEVSRASAMQENLLRNEVTHLQDTQTIDSLRMELDGQKKLLAKRMQELEELGKKNNENVDEINTLRETIQGYQQKTKGLEGDVNALKKQIEELKKQDESRSAEMRDMDALNKKQLKQLEEQHQAQSKTIEEAHKKQLDSLQKQLDDLQALHAALEAERDSLKKELEKMRETINKANKTSEDQKAQMVDMLKNSELNESEAEMLRQEKEILVGNLKGLREDLERNRQEKAQLEKDKQALLTKEQALAAQCNKLKTDLDALDGKHRSLQEEGKSRELKLSEARAEVQKATEGGDLQRKINELQTELAVLRADKETLLMKNQALEAASTGLTRDLQSLQKEMEILKQDFAVVDHERLSLKTSCDNLMKENHDMSSKETRPCPPVFHPPGGQHMESLSINILAPKKQSTIYYTTDLSDPSKANHQGSGQSPLKVLVPRSTTIKAICVNSVGQNDTPSEIVMESYAMLSSEKAIGGAGLLISKRDSDGVIVVKQVVPNGPAAKDGQIDVGDKLLAVDLAPVHGLRLAQVCSAIQGFVDSEVILSVEKNIGGATKQIQVNLIRSTRPVDDDASKPKTPRTESMGFSPRPSSTSQNQFA